MSDTLRAAAQQALEAFDPKNGHAEHMWPFHVKALQAQACKALRAALAAAVAEPVAAEPLKGWKLNHVQFVRGSGTAEIGYLDPEDDRFWPIVTVDTGLYYQAGQAVPLARAILDALSAAPAAPPQREPQWQPIETAPDRTPFSAIVASPLPSGEHYVEEAWWDDERRQWWPANVDHTDARGSAIYPTHWMPLPDAPASAPKEAP